MKWNKKKILNRIFWTSIAFLLLWMMVSTIALVFDLEFASDTITGIYWISCLFLAPVAILLTLTKTLKGKWRLLIPVQVVLTIFTSIVPILVLVLYTILNECYWTEVEVLFEKKGSWGEKIVSGQYECWTTAEIPGAASNRHVKNLGLIFQYSEHIDTAQIEPIEWRRVQTKEIP